MKMPDGLDSPTAVAASSTGPTSVLASAAKNCYLCCDLCCASSKLNAPKIMAFQCRVVTADHRLWQLSAGTTGQWQEPWPGVRACDVAHGPFDALFIGEPNLHA